MRGAARADQLPVLAPLQRHLAGRRRRRHLRQLAVVGRASRGMADDAVAGRPSSPAGCFQAIDAAPTRRARAVAAARRSTSQASTTLDEPPVTLMPSSRAILATTHWPAARRRALVAGLGLARMEVRQAGDHRRDVAVEAIGTGRDQAHARQRHVELLGDEHRQRGVHALAHLAPVHRQQHGAVGGDLDPAVEADLAVRRPAAGRRAPSAVARRQHAPADDQRAGGAEAAQEQRAPSHALVAPAPAARIAARRRG